MDEAVKMAVVEDQLPQFTSNPTNEDDGQTTAQPQQLTSSIVDDVFFVIKECLQRAQMTYNVNTICAIINLADQQLSSLFLDTLTHNSKQQSTLQATLTRKAAATPTTIAVALNNLELSAEYIKRLKAEMDSSIQRQFSGVQKDVQKITAVLDDIQQTEKRFSHILHGNMELLATSLLPRLQASLEARLIDASYVLTEEEYAQNQINDPYMQQFIAEIESSLAAFQRFLTPGNTELLFETISRAFAEQIESHLLLQSATTYSATGSSSSAVPGNNEKAELKRFNLLGAQQFDRDVRNLLGFFTANMVSKTVRDKFARINQMSFLLNLEKESEVLDYWGAKASDGLSWRLSPSEVRRVLALRIDFNREAIVKLRL
jgi:conserved oligomeric Golgi complex subunit 4